MSRPSRADILADKRLAEYRTANPMTFDGFCKLFNIKPEERVQLGVRLAEIRYQRTLTACGLSLGYLREPLCSTRGEPR